ncbi:sensor histidine kinase [Kitasatospora sp. RG8]|uniref:sensor histidine kinase n=1 Tax=Kitasatospora sp. RG8 TaxID=2820815 RepID=UPI0027DB7F77|nr:sensor histidine kinase [Kitasatospora sp. RG8]
MARGHRLAAWAGGACYPVVVLLLMTGAPRANGDLHALGGLLAGSLLLGLLRRRPLTALALTLFGALSVVVLSPGQSAMTFLPFLTVDLVLGLVVATRSRRTSIAAVAVALLLQFLAVGLFTRPDNMVGVALVALLALVTCCVVGLLLRERREHAVALRSQEIAEAVTAERLRIARELHDMVAHSIGIIAIQAGVGSRVIETQPAEAREALRAIESTSRETLAGLRRTLVALRQADADTGTGSGSGAGSGSAPLAPTPGLADVERLVAATADAGVRVEVQWAGERRRLPADIDLSAYRIVQEAVTNVVRHAGTGSCRVAIDYGVEELSVEVLDDGRGTPSPAGSGFGITGMRERVSLLHGRFSAGPRPEGGFRVAARLPLPRTVSRAVPQPAPQAGSRPVPPAVSQPEPRAGSRPAPLAPGTGRAGVR